MGKINGHRFARWANSVVKMATMLVLVGICLSQFQSQLHATIIGQDDRKRVLLEDERAVEFALRTPRVQYCGNYTTTGILTRRMGDDSDYLLLNAQHLFNGIGKFNRFDSDKDGRITRKDKRCSLKDLKNAFVAFNLVFAGTKFHEFGRTAERGVFAGDPINLKDASHYLLTGENVLILKLNKQISEQVMPHNGKKRGYSKFLPVGEYHAKGFDQRSSNIAFHHDTAHYVMKSDGCKIRHFSVLDDPRISFKSACDAQPGSSNSPLYIEYNNQSAIWGLIVGGSGKIQSENAAIGDWISVATTEHLVKEYGLETIDLTNNGYIQQIKSP